MAQKKTPAKKPDNKKPDDENEETEETTEESEEEEQDENQRINAIVTSRVKREMKGVLAQLSQLNEAIKSLSTAPKKEETEEEEETEENETPKRESKTDAKTMRQLTKLQKELQEEKEARKKAELAQKEEQAKAARQEMLGMFDSALTEHGVSDPKLRKAALRLLEEEGYMVRDEETGKIRYKGVDKYGLETMYDPKAGVKLWVQSEGKSFIPAVEAGGSGTGPARQGLGNTNLTKGEFGKLSPQQKAAIELERASQGLPPLE